MHEPSRIQHVLVRRVHEPQSRRRKANDNICSKPWLLPQMLCFLGQNAMKQDGTGLLSLKLHLNACRPPEAFRFDYLQNSSEQRNNAFACGNSHKESPGGGFIRSRSYFTLPYRPWRVYSRPSTSSSPSKHYFSFISAFDSAPLSPCSLISKCPLSLGCSLRYSSALF